MIGQTKYYNNRPVTILKDEGNDFYFVAAELNLTHDQTGSNWCTMCQAGGDFIASHTCDTAQEVIDHLMEGIEDREVFWVSGRYLNDEPFEFKPYKKLVDEIELMKSKKIDIETDIKDLKSTLSSIELSIEESKQTLSDFQLRIQQAQHDLMDVEKQEQHQSIPDRVSNSYIDISTKELLEFIEAKIKLEALESGGVDNWEWYSESLKETDYESEAIIELSRMIKK